MTFEKVKLFAGEVTEDDMKYVDYYIGENMGIFIPNGGLFEYALDPHTLPAYMFAFMYHERAYVCIDSRMIPLKPGGLLSVSPNVEHYEVPMDMQSRYCAVNIRPDYLATLFKNFTGKTIPEYRGEYNKLISDLPELVNKYIYEYEQKDLGYESICLSLENIIIQKILRSLIGNQQQKAEIHVRHEIEKSVQYMYHHLHRKIKLDDLAKDIGMSVSQFSKVFKDELGTSPMDYLNEIRLERAKRMLLIDKASIIQISQECGFGSTSYFTSRFKLKYRVSPSEYRKRNRVKKAR